MDVYSRLMNIDEVVECLNRKTDTDISFDKNKVLKLVENRIIPIVFKFEGFVTWGCVSKGKYQYYSIEMSGYFNFTDESKAIGIFEGSLDEIPLSKAIIYHLDSPDIRGGSPDGIKPEKGDIVLFKTGGRPPALTPGLTPYLTTELSYLSIENSIKIYNNKVGVLKVDLEEYLKKKKIEAMENDTKMEALESKNEKLKSENSNLRKQLEELAIANSLIEQKEQDINELKEKLRLHSEEATKDKQLSYKSQMTVARMLYAILAEHKYDLSATKGKTNQLIEIASQSHGTSVSRNFISEWIKLANQAKNDSIK